MCPRPLCFVAMPFGKRTDPVDANRWLDFDSVYRAIAAAATAEGLECVRAEFDATGDFIRCSMHEALLVAEYVIADLTFCNSNVSYAVGVRHGGAHGPTLLVCEQGAVPRLPFNFAPLRVVPYSIRNDIVEPESTFEQQLRERLRLARSGELASDYPLAQVTALKPGAEPGHEKTDIFMKRLEFAGELAGRVEAALRGSNDVALAALEALEAELLSGSEMRQLHSALLAIYLGYRAKKGWAKMLSLYGAMPKELKRTPVAREQAALASNRLAEAALNGIEQLPDLAARSQRIAQAEAFRLQAIQLLDRDVRATFSSETWSILGRIYKGQYDAAYLAARDPDSDEAARTTAGKRAQDALSAGIEAYENGLLADPRDSYPGINAVTLRAIRGTAEDDARNQVLIEVVGFALERGAEPNTADERYWRCATRLELACAKKSWKLAEQQLENLRVLPAESWMHETTANNLRLLARGRISDPEATAKLQSYADALLV
jgi:hypothetical protein